MHVPFTCKKKDDSIKMKELERSQHFYHYKYIEIFPDAQGQLILQPLVQYGQISNLSGRSHRYWVFTSTLGS